ncbi:hypothetical protein LEP1GSC072_3822 [Leptospira noguchii str. Bonito]|nr:hypothetical protein LEP1GSC072_3822 [Leptospira noguchii str. Bonito]
MWELPHSIDLLKRIYSKILEQIPEIFKILKKIGQSNF